MLPFKILYLSFTIIMILSVLFLVVMVSSCFLRASSCVQLMLALLMLVSGGFLPFLFFALYFSPCMDEDLWFHHHLSINASRHVTCSVICFHLAARCKQCLTFRYYPGYFIASHLVLQKNKDIYRPFPQMVFLFIPEGEGSSNNNDCEAFKTGRLPKPWRQVSHLKEVFRLFSTLQRYRWRPGTGFTLYG